MSHEILRDGQAEYRFSAFRLPVEKETRSERLQILEQRRLLGARQRCAELVTGVAHSFLRGVSLAWLHVGFRLDFGPCILDVTPRAGRPTLRAR